MTTRPVKVGPLTIGGGAPLALIGGPCAIENEKHALMTAERLAALAAAASTRSVWRQRKAGIWSTSSTAAAGSISDT